MELMNQIQEYDLEDHVHLLKRREDMPFLNAGVDIVSLSSAYGEALPLTLCEGMSCGTPCVATDIGDSRGILGDTGLIVEPENPAALAQAWQEMLALSDEEYRQCAQQARARIIQHYSLSRMVDQYKQVYTETINRA
jgi:glycosyltransferase involved in cell wall biosynthesis